MKAAVSIDPVRVNVYPALLITVSSIRAPPSFTG
jgi:hypothetical protein